jgi:hypothetical protein
MEHLKGASTTRLAGYASDKRYSLFHVDTTLISTSTIKIRHSALKYFKLIVVMLTVAFCTVTLSVVILTWRLTGPSSVTKIKKKFYNICTWEPQRRGASEERKADCC